MVEFMKRKLAFVFCDIVPLPWEVGPLRVVSNGNMKRTASRPWTLQAGGFPSWFPVKSNPKEVT